MNCIICTVRIEIEKVTSKILLQIFFYHKFERGFVSHIQHSNVLGSFSTLVFILCDLGNGFKTLHNVYRFLLGITLSVRYESKYLRHGSP